MKSLSLALGAIFLGLASSMYVHSGAHKHGYHLHHFHVVPTSETPHGLENAMNGTLDVEVHAGDLTMVFDLELKREQWAPGAQIITDVDEDGNPTKTEPLFHRGYKGWVTVRHAESARSETGRASVTFFEDGRASMTAITDEDVYEIMAIEEKDDLPLKGRDAGHRMYMTRMSDYHDHGDEAEEGKRDGREYLKQRGGVRRLLQAARFKFNNCFPGQNGQRAIRVGMLADSSFQQVTGGASQARNAMVSDLNKASDLIYEPQLRVWMLVGRIYTGNVPSGAVSPCNVGTSQRLSRFRDWRRTQGKDQHAIWHLYSNCHPPPGTVGVAYVGVLCSPTYGAGWSNYIRNGGTWKVVAHEIGHNFNSPHSFDNGQGRTGGIMDYGDGKYPAPGQANRVFAFNPLRRNDVCGGISKSLNAANTYLIPPNRCWTTFGGPAPRPTPSPTNQPRPVTAPTPRPVVRPTRRPTTRPTNPTCRGVTTRAGWWIRRNNGGCTQYRQALRMYKPCIPQVTACSIQYNSRYPTWRLFRATFVTSRQEMSQYNYNAWRNGIEAKLRTIRGVRFYRRRRLTAGTEPPAQGSNTTNGDPWITYDWVRALDLTPNDRMILNGTIANYTGCTPSCGPQRYKLELYVCMQTANNTRNGGGVNLLVVEDSLCTVATKPIKPVACAASACAGNLCGNGVINPNEVCDPTSESCCSANCQSFEGSPLTCLPKNKKIDGTFMTCLNDVTKSNCFLYVFQGMYFMKYRAVPSANNDFYSPQWLGAIKHKGTLQPNWDNVTAVGGGRNGQIWAFNKLEFLQIDFSNGNVGKVMKSGNVNATWGAPSEFVKCGSVTAAEVVGESNLILFCKNMYVYMDIPTEKVGATVFPADLVFDQSGDVGVNAMYFDVRDSTWRIFRRNEQQFYQQPGTPQLRSSMMASIFGSGPNPNISTSNCAIKDPQCIKCSATGVQKCAQCATGYKVLVNRCVADSTLIDMTFAKGSQNDKYYSSDPKLQSATFTLGHGGGQDSAMVFTPTTAITAHAPTLNGRTVKDFRVEVFYKPSTTTKQRLISIDGRFEIDLESSGAGNPAGTMKVFVRFDQLSFDCYVAKPLTAGKWNLIAVEFANRQLITSANGFEHNRGFSTAGSPPSLGLTFQNVVIGSTTNGLNGELDSLQIKEVPVLTGNVLTATEPAKPAPWVLPIVIVACVLACCLTCGISYLMYQRGMCACCEPEDKSGDVNMAFLSAQGQNGGGNYVAM